jgi:hypothetical protein
MTNDSSGNVYATGYVGTDNSPANLFGQSIIGNQDYMLIEYDNNLNLKLIKLIGASDGGPDNEAIGNAIALDSSNNIYIAGSTTVSLNPGVSQVGHNSYFLAKYDNNGNVLWSKQYGNANTSTDAGTNQIAANGVAVSGTNIYVVGYTKYPLNGGSMVGTQDYFIAKFDNNGAVEFRNFYKFC